MDSVHSEAFAWPLAAISVARDAIHALALQDGREVSSDPVRRAAEARTQSRIIPFSFSRCAMARVMSSALPRLDRRTPRGCRICARNSNRSGTTAASTTSREMKLSTSVRNSAPYSADADAGSRSISAFDHLFAERGVHGPAMAL